MVNAMIKVLVEDWKFTKEEATRIATEMYSEHIIQR